MAVSLVGDGIFLIAIAWETYVLWNAPAALSIVGIGMTVPTVVFLLLGGVLSDRHDRRLLMLWADVVRAARGRLPRRARLRRRAPAVGARRPRRALRLRDGVLHAGLRGDRPRPAAGGRPRGGQLARPVRAPDRAAARSGRCSAAGSSRSGAGLAFAVDAASFAASARRGARCCGRERTQASSTASHGAAVREGLAFIRRRVWLWGTLAAAAAAYLVFLGPSEVLLPYMVKNELHASAARPRARLRGGRCRRDRRRDSGWASAGIRAVT